MATDEIEQFFTDEIDQRLERLQRAKQRGDDLGRAWHKAVLAALVALRRARRAHP
jgi:hypothetical protein